MGPGAASASLPPRQFCDDVDFLLASSSRKAAISRESASQRGVVPGLRLRRRKAGRFTVRFDFVLFGGIGRKIVSQKVT